jgi:TRAP-type transport system small permease protein
MSAEADNATEVAAPAVHPIASFVRVVLGLLLLGMVALNVVSALCRYVFGIVFTGADEVLVFSMVWMVMVGMILVTIDRKHIALDFIMTRANDHQRAALSALHHLVMTGACAYAAFYCWQFVGRVASIGQTSMALGLPMAIPHSALVIGFAGTAIAAALLLIADVSTLARGRSPQAGH